VRVPPQRQPHLGEGILQDGQDGLAAPGYPLAMAHPHVFAMVLAGGEGKRLAPLTADRAKPAVPFGGDYRLDRHIATWRMSPLLGNYVTPVPAQMRRGPRWFAGSADAILA
jgi:glucose-1-phosphate adenylyltransferase